MRTFSCPIVVVSKCMGFAACRWNGENLPDPFVESLKPLVDYRPVCPECEIGLGVPRDPIRVVEVKKVQRLMQPATGRDCSDPMRRFAEEFLGSIEPPDGFLLKSRSPSCGTRDVKVYPSTEKSQVISSKAAGFFGSEVLRRFGHLAVEDEARVNDYRIREHFLTRLFTIADFRKIAAAPDVGELSRFHGRNKYLLMACSQKQLKLLGAVAANHEHLKPAEVVKRYGEELSKAFEKPPRYTSLINALMHAFGHVSEGLKPDERKYFLDALERYRKTHLPLSVPVGILRSHVVRFGDEYLSSQTLFEPYPEVLVSVTDSGKGRNR